MKSTKFASGKNDMIDKQNTAFHYVRYRLRSKSEFDVHSPFMFRFFRDVINDRNSYPEYRDIESFRKKLVGEPGYITRSEFGARSIGTPWAKRFIHIRNIVRNSAVSPKYGQLLFRIARDLKPATILELGTSLGISTLYLARGHPATKLVSIEGCPNTADAARRNFDKSGVLNVDLRIGDFDRELPAVLGELNTVDLAFFDGNHRKEPTLEYFNQTVQHAGNDSVFIFDDIHWSREMSGAWKEIRKHPSVRVTVDLFRMGLVFFREGLSKEDFLLRF